MRENEGVEFLEEAGVVGVLFALADADTDVRLDLLPTVPAVLPHVVQISRRTDWGSAFAPLQRS